MNKTLILIIVLTLISCKNRNETFSFAIDKNQDPYQIYISLFKENPKFIASDFDYPIGKPNAEGYYNAQKFRENNHLGDDWNGVGGGNTDLGDPIYAIANGYVSFAKDIKGGWGNVIRVIHKYKGKYYESVYAHCDSIRVKEGDFVKKRCFNSNYR